jgi:hypothetical protein
MRTHCMWHEQGGTAGRPCSIQSFQNRPLRVLRVGLHKGKERSRPERLVRLVVVSQLKRKRERVGDPHLFLPAVSAGSGSLSFREGPALAAHPWATFPSGGFSEHFTFVEIHSLRQLHRP